MFDFFKKKPEVKKEGLEQALKLGLITQEELLKLELWRTEKKLKELGGALPEARSHHRKRT